MGNLFKKLLGNLNFNFLNRTNSLSNQNKVNVGRDGQVHVNQAGGDINYGAQQVEDISDIERRVLIGLYRQYREGGRRPVRWNARNTHQELGIVDGTYVGMLQNSRYVILDGEHYVITDDGIRYMDARVSQNKPKIDLHDGISVSGGAMGNYIRFEINNVGVNTARNIRWHLTSDDAETKYFALDYNLGPGETSHQIEYEYSATPFYQQKLNNIRIEFCYEDENSFPFSSGRALGSQEPKQDGMFRFPAGKGREYLEG